MEQQEEGLKRTVGVLGLSFNTTMSFRQGKTTRNPIMRFPTMFEMTCPFRDDILVEIKN